MFLLAGSIRGDQERPLDLPLHLEALLKLEIALVF